MTKILVVDKGLIELPEKHRVGAFGPFFVHTGSPGYKDLYTVTVISSGVKVLCCSSLDAARKACDLLEKVKQADWRNEDHTKHINDDLKPRIRKIVFEFADKKWLRKRKGRLQSLKKLKTDKKNAKNQQKEEKKEELDVAIEAPTDDLSPKKRIFKG